MNLINKSDFFGFRQCSNSWCLVHKGVGVPPKLIGLLVKGVELAASGALSGLSYALTSSVGALAASGGFIFLGCYLIKGGRHFVFKHVCHPPRQDRLSHRQRDFACHTIQVSSAMAMFKPVIGLGSLGLGLVSGAGYFWGESKKSTEHIFGPESAGAGAFVKGITCLTATGFALLFGRNALRNAFPEPRPMKPELPFIAPQASGPPVSSKTKALTWGVLSLASGAFALYTAGDLRDQIRRFGLDIVIGSLGLACATVTIGFCKIAVGLTAAGKRSKT